MTLINARRRFAELGYEVQKDVSPYRYKCRRIGALSWIRHHDLEAMLIVAKGGV